MFISWIFTHNIQLNILKQGEITIKFSSKAVIIQDAYVIKNKAAGNVHYLYSDGQRIKKNSDMIYIYPESEQNLYTSFIILTEDLTDLKKSLLTSGSVQSNEVTGMKRERDEIMLRIYGNDADYRSLEITTDLIRASNDSIINSRYESDEENYDVLNLEEQIADIQMQLLENNMIIKSPESGIFTSKTDGYEVSSSRDLLSSLTEDLINEMILNPISERYSENNIGKLITSDIYYFAVIITEDVKVLLEEKEYIRISFPEIPEPFYVVNHQIIPVENNKYILVLKTDKYLEKLINKRVIDLDILISSERGILIPKAALFERDPVTGTANIFISRNGYIKKINVAVTAEDKQDAIIGSELLEAHDLLVVNPEKAREGMFIK
jgi:hypothetical protein